MTNKIITVDLLAGARIRTGVPNEEPTEAIQALCQHLSSRPAVLSARLGLMQVLKDGSEDEGFFTYTIGIACDSEAQCVTEMNVAMNAIIDLPTGRWPITFFPPINTYFTPESRVFYERKSSTKSSLLGRIFGIKRGN